MPTIGGKPKSVADLKSKLLRPALTSHFQCWFYPPREVERWINDKSISQSLGSKVNSELQELVSISCSEASLPGSSLATHDIQNDFTGVTEKHVYRRMYDNKIDFTFYVNHDYDIIHYFENWMSFTVNESRSEGLQNPNYNYRVNFPNSYKSTLYVQKFEKDFTGEQLVYNFVNAYPISINSMPVMYEASQLLKCTVSFNYSRYIISAEDAVPRTIFNSEVSEVFR